MLKLTNITKTFPGVKALENVSLDLAPGEVVAIIGENGAGKSTLMKILSGVHRADSGTIEFEGRPYSVKSPSDALDKGIRIIYQELSGLDNLDIASNIFLGREFKNGPFVDQKKLNEESVHILKRVGLDVAPTTQLSHLSIAEKQLVEIARALSLKVKVLILDEPTSSLTLEETQNLLNIVRDLKSQGVSILYITHRLDEVQQIADRVVGLRDGKNAGDLTREEISKDAMVKMMIGREIIKPDHWNKNTGEVALRLVNFCSARYPNSPINLDIRYGEILGMAGLVGAGRSELVRAVYGIDPYKGSLEICGKAIRIRSPKDAILYGIFLAPDRVEIVVLTLAVFTFIRATDSSAYWHSRFRFIRPKFVKDFNFGIETFSFTDISTVRPQPRRSSGARNIPYMMASFGDRIRIAFPESSREPLYGSMP